MLVESTVPVVIRFSKLALVEQDFWIYVSIRGPHSGSGLNNQERKARNACSFLKQSLSQEQARLLLEAIHPKV